MVSNLLLTKDYPTVFLAGDLMADTLSHQPICRLTFLPSKLLYPFHQTFIVTCEPCLQSILISCNFEQQLRSGPNYTFPFKAFDFNFNLAFVKIIANFPANRKKEYL